MKSQEIRKQFLEFFKSKSHSIVPSAPMVIKDDPTLMFTNAGNEPVQGLFSSGIPYQKTTGLPILKNVFG